MLRDFILCLQEATFQFILKKSAAPTDPSECFINPPCGCINPGQNLQCEDCPYLEACLSSVKTESKAREISETRENYYKDRLNPHI